MSKTASQAPSTSRLPRDLAYFRLKEEVESFLYEEAELLDTRCYGEWLGLLAEDIVYFMPMKRNVRFGLHEQDENTRFGKDISWFEEDKWTLAKRVEQIQTGVHWAEEPLSRITHIVTNIQLVSVAPDAERAAEVVARSRFFIYQNRVQYETAMFVGRRTDTLRRVDGDWKLARREIQLDQNVLLAKNLTVFF